MTDWKPLSIREDRGIDDYEGPFEGVPEWLFAPMWAWVSERYPIWAEGHYRRAAVTEYRRIGMALRLPLDNPLSPNPDRANDLQNNLYGLVYEDRNLLLDVVDFALSQMGAATHRIHRASLQVILSQAGSVYRVEEADVPYLARRVAPELQAAADAQIGAGRPGEHLARAWRAVYGRNPDPSDGYREAIKAVEAATIPIVSPANDRATLGTVIADIRNDPTKWVVSLHSPNPEEQIPAVRGMLELLWKGQTDRHGTPDPSAPLDVSQGDAEAALHLALTLVQWFTSGVITTT